MAIAAGTPTVSLVFLSAFSVGRLWSRSASSAAAWSAICPLGVGRGGHEMAVESGHGIR